MAGRTWIASGLSIVAAAALAALALASDAGAHIYYGAQDPEGYHHIVRANLDGGDPDPYFYPANGPVCGVAVDATSVYWTTSNGSVWSVNLDGAPESHFGISGLDHPCGIAVDATHGYYAEQGADSIGRFALDHASIDPNFVTLGAGAAPCGVAVDATHVYWAEGVGPFGFAIKRAPLAGGPTETMTTSASGKCGVAVDAAHVYWSNANLSGGPPGTTIGRMDKLPGSGVNNAFISGAANPCGVAVSPSNVYWANHDLGSIGRANLDGTGAEQSLITGLPDPCGLAVDTAGPASTPGEFRLGKPKLDRKKGTATVAVTVRAAGEIELSGAKVKTAHASATFGKVTLRLKATGGAKRKLAERGKVTVRFAVTFTPAVGSPTSERGSAKLVKRD